MAGVDAVDQILLFEQTQSDAAVNFCRSPIRWAGSKRSLLNKISKRFPQETKLYIEPFAGSASIFFGSNFYSGILSDTNTDLINFYRELSINFVNLYNKMVEFERDEETYYKLRRKINDMSLGTDRAAIFFYLNRNCFNGLYRTNEKGEFNVPFAKGAQFSYPKIENIEIASRKLLNSILLCDDFERVIDQHLDQASFFYIDPPYYVEEKRVFREYGSSGFCLSDFYRLCKCLERIDKSGGKFLLSYPRCSLSQPLIATWKYEEISINRTIAANRSSRTATVEYLISNF